MRASAEIKNELLDALANVLDVPLRKVGFARNSRSFAYKRMVDDCEQRITFVLHCRPHYQPGAEAHISPTFQLIMRQVTEKALALVKGDKMLFAGSGAIILGQPIEFTAPKENHQRWFATGDKQFVAACHSIEGFLGQWVLPFLSEVSTTADLIKLYETKDVRIIKHKRWYIFIAAAYQIQGQLD